MNENLLFELYFEDIPSSYLLPFSVHIEEKAVEFFNESKLSYSSVAVFFTPRRLALLVNGLSSKQLDSEITVTGPSVKIAFSSEETTMRGEDILSGLKPTKALEGFLKKNNAAKDDIFIEKNEKGEFVCIKKSIQGSRAETLIPPWIKNTLSTVKFPKAMRWEPSGFRFARPIRNIVLLYGGKVVPLEIAGVTSTDKTLSGDIGKKREILLTPENYSEELRKNDIIADFYERKKILKEKLQKKSSELGGKLIEDEELLDEVSNLVEFPVLVSGSLPETYMNLPKEIITTALKSHQRDFSVWGKNDSLLPYFIYVADGISQKAAQNSVKGNETIVGSRLEDAYFYYHEDTKIPLEDYLESLNEMTYMKGLGSLGDKTLRLSAMAEFLCGFCPEKIDLPALKRASFLCKCDMATSMIRDGKEFTSLQGVIGYYYALKSGETELTSRIIKEHYLDWDPYQSEASNESVVLGLADKMDHLCGFISKLGAPTGSADPYALRKSANTIINFLLANKWHISFEKWIEKNLDLYFRSGFMTGEEREKALREIQSYLDSRLSKLLKDRNLRYDVVDASMAYASNDCLKALEIAEALADFREKENFIDLAVASKRTERILEGFLCEKEPQEKLFSEPQEKELFLSLKKSRPFVENFVLKKDYRGAMEELLKLKKPVDDFFDNVMVNTEDTVLEENRKALLLSASHLFKKFADLSKIVIEGKEKNHFS
ncbi:glycine--tRNA ligase subunit beta [candidate division WOR-3 bacterium]|nr:glycine--tRNA ligase subunit beta [candidate division WOR-3 bacterium]